MATFHCKICGATHNAPPYDGDFVRYDGAYYCCDCLIKKRTAPRTKKDRWLDDESTNRINQLRGETLGFLRSSQAKDDLFAFIDDHYAPSFVPQYFYMKMQSIFDGTFKGLKRPIPPEHLLDMFRQKANYLDKQAVQKWGSEPPDPISRINYDLAILLSRYDRYLAHLQAVKAEQEDALRQAKESAKVKVTPTAPQPSKKDLDIASIVNDLF